ncbi:MAG: response regulator [bacterium]|nr:response regulator [bacterium]
MAKIVVVSSSTLQLQILEKRLKEVGHSVACFASGLELEDKITTESPDLVLMDVFFSGGNGFQACREMRKSIRFEKLPIILCGEAEREDDTVWAKGQGASGYLVKPLEASKLLATVESHLSS